jgi:microcystin-dependent protein
MSQPQRYNRSASFTNLQAANPTGQPPGSSLDIEFNNVKITLDQLIANLALLQRDDGAPKNASIGRVQLKPEVTVGFNTPTVWVTGTTYGPADTSFHGAGFYRCLVSHTSGTFATDLAAGKWELIVDLSALPLVAAQQISVVPSGTLTTDVQGSLQALDAGKAATSHTHVASAISDSTAAGRAILTAADLATQLAILGITNNTFGAAPGDIKQTAALTLQSGWYWCDGSAKNRTTDAALFAAITITQTATLTNASASVTVADTTGMSPGMPLSGTGIPANTTIQFVNSGTTFTMSANATQTVTTPIVVAPHGVGDGSSTFNLPQMNGVVPVGLDNIGGTAKNISQVSTTISTTSASTSATVASATGLARGMYVTSLNVPAGTTITAISGTTVTLSAAATATASGTAARFSPLLDAQTMGALGGELAHTLTAASIPSHSHTFTGALPGHSHAVSGLAGGSGGTFANGPDVGTTTFTTSSVSAGTPAGTNSSTGGDGAHNNTQPTRAFNYIIKR